MTVALTKHAYLVARDALLEGDPRQLDALVDHMLALLARHQPGWSPVLAFTVDGDPVGASRPRVVARKNGPGTIAYMPKTHTDWEAKAVSAAQSAMAIGRCLLHDPRGRTTLDGPVGIELVAVHRRPGRLRRRKDPRERLPAPCKPDADNILKLAMDALSKARVYTDDARVVYIRASVVYQAIERHIPGQGAQDAERPRVIIGVYADTTGARPS